MMIFVSFMIRSIISKEKIDFNNIHEILFDFDIKELSDLLKRKCNDTLENHSESQNTESKLMVKKHIENILNDNTSYNDIMDDLSNTNIMDDWEKANTVEKALYHSIFYSSLITSTIIC